MKVRSALLTEMSGKIGGAVASKARGGIQYFRKLVTPSNPRTFLQTAMRSAVGSVSALWRDVLTEEQQQAWWDLADEVGSSATGKTLFSRVNQPRIYANNNERLTDNAGDPEAPLDPIAEPPPSMSVGNTTPDSIVIDASANTLAFTSFAGGEWNADATADPAAVIYVFASAGQRSSQFSRSHPYQMIRAYRVGAPGAYAVDPIDLAGLGLPTIAGYVMYIKYYAQATDGRLSVPVEQRVEIVP